MIKPLKSLVLSCGESLAAEKLKNFGAFFESHKKCALAFSGGIDSSFLLYAGLGFGADIRPFYVKTVFQPDFEYKDALAVASLLGVKPTVICREILSVPKIAENPSDRCYYCKQAIFASIIEKASAEGFDIVIDGTNASDDASDRPGMKALAEQSVISPLRNTGLFKNEIRLLLKEAGFGFWDKPAYSCLATRVVTGEVITPELLSCVEKAENALFELGFSDFRVRTGGGGAKLQFVAEQTEKANGLKDLIIEKIKPFFGKVSTVFETRVGH